MAIDPDKLNAFMGKAVDDIGAAKRANPTWCSRATRSVSIKPWQRPIPHPPSSASTKALDPVGAAKKTSHKMGPG